MRANTLKHHLAAGGTAFGTLVNEFATSGIARILAAGADFALFDMEHTGFAVSPGRVTAPASVIRSPADFGEIAPGTILVRATTTPAWTPLFAQACGLVTDIGGILAHGSIVAREYGIPAAMGTGNATQRFTSGQHITADSDAGTVTLVV